MVILGVIACSSYAPGDAADQALESSDTVVVTIDQWISFMPVEPNPTTGLIFYPGGLVQPEAYAPPIRMIAESGMAAHIIPMPADLAIFGIQRGEWIMEAYPDISTWLVAGHSLGAVAAASFADQHPDQTAGLALWAGYPARSVDLTSSTFPVISMVGARDGVINKENLEASERQLPDHTDWLQIGGGNHAQFGDYGPQTGDNEATIRPITQWAYAAERTLDLVESFTTAPAE